jgi:hypothetical protein
MVLNIRGSETERLVETLAKPIRATKVGVETSPSRDRLGQIRRRDSARRLADELEDITLHCVSLPVLNATDAEEISGYDEHEIPA